MRLYELQMQLNHIIEISKTLVTIIETQFKIFIFNKYYTILLTRFIYNFYFIKCNCYERIIRTSSWNIALDNLD
jgi:hypothetical protein